MSDTSDPPNHEKERAAFSKRPIAIQNQPDNRPNHSPGLAGNQLKSSYESPNGQCCLFANDRKLEDHHSDFSGEITIGSESFWVNAWQRTSRHGRPFLKISVKPK